MLEFWLHFIQRIHCLYIHSNRIWFIMYVCMSCMAACIDCHHSSIQNMYFHKRLFIMNVYLYDNYYKTDRCRRGQTTYTNIVYSPKTLQHKLFNISKFVRRYFNFASRDYFVQQFSISRARDSKCSRDLRQSSIIRNKHGLCLRHLYIS